MESATEKKEMKIFVVDDDPYFNELLKLFLTEVLLPEARQDELNISLDVQTFSNGRDAMRELKEKPDALLLDIHFEDSEQGPSPTPNGFDVLRKAKETSPETTVILISRYRDWEPFRAKLKSMGAADYVSKSPALFGRIGELVMNRIAC